VRSHNLLATLPCPIAIKIITHLTLPHASAAAAVLSSPIHMRPVFALLWTDLVQLHLRGSDKNACIMLIEQNCAQIASCGWQPWHPGCTLAR
jgi:hypothetical protein